MHSNKIAVSVFFAANGFLFTNYISRLPLIQSEFALDNGAIGMVLLASALGALIAMPFTGWLITEKGSRQILTVAALLFCLVIPLIGFMPGGIALSLLFFVIGLATGTMDVSMNSQAVLVEKTLQRPVMSFFHALFSAGMMFGAGCGALFTHFQAGLLVHLISVSLPALAAVLWAIRGLVPDRGQVTSGRKKRFQLPEASLIGVGLIAFCCMLGEGAMANWSTNYMLRIASADSGFAPMGLVAFSLAMMTARFLGDRVRDRMGDRHLLIGSSMVAVAGLGLALLIPHPIVVLIGLLLVGLGLSVVVPIAYSTAGQAPGLAPGVGIGMVTTIGYGGLLLGPPIIGFLADWQGLRIALAFTLVLFVLMVLLSFRFRPASA
ncbi:MFS transporter [Flavilitoribacter nigricans]|uniref:MFS transporter n=1 Tax=Flavilitoribacter nigricans (strain ATCC 23147 / DSM 23189 / NBRC 102662 / NCIMB 1420 / SS-2) TaxID=1122177 RepID=A0A2D0N7R6_FLAN2|nr:MFS transporter [Flavilitoribacter nigricans]PHN04564.1 MFS transporter [Flavilitoribacter nigricans DSM 23189 = NBRC 102662]